SRLLRPACPIHLRSSNYKAFIPQNHTPLLLPPRLTQPSFPHPRFHILPLPLPPRSLLAPHHPQHYPTRQPVRHSLPTNVRSIGTPFISPQLFQPRRQHVVSHAWPHPPTILFSSSLP